MLSRCCQDWCRDCCQDCYQDWCRDCCPDSCQDCCQDKCQDCCQDSCQNCCQDCSQDCCKDCCRDCFSTGCLKKNFLLWKLAVANITADNEKSTIIFLENARDSFVVHIFIIWLGYILDIGKVISIQHQTWKTTRRFGTNSSYVPTHLIDVREGLGILLLFAKAHYGFLTASSNICHGQISLQ